MLCAEVNFMTRKMASVLKPNVIISGEGDTWTLKTESTFKTSETSFKIGEEYEETTADGRTVMVFSFQCSFNNITISKLVYIYFQQS